MPLGRGARHDVGRGLGGRFRPCPRGAGQYRAARLGRARGRRLGQALERNRGYHRRRHHRRGELSMTDGASTAVALLDALRRINRGVAMAVGLFLLACAAFVLSDILLRQVEASFGGTDEISGYVMAIATSWGMGYALIELGHVRIDLIRSRGGAVVRALFDLFALATNVTVPASVASAKRSKSARTTAPP